MNTERVITLAHCGDFVGCMFNDRISITFSPSEVTTLEIIFKKLALEAEDYGKQTEMREMRSAFGQAYHMWGNRNKKYD